MTWIVDVLEVSRAFWSQFTRYVRNLAVMSCITGTFLSDGAHNMPYSTADHTSLQQDTPRRSRADFQPLYVCTVPWHSQLALISPEKFINWIITLCINDTVLIETCAAYVCVVQLFDLCMIPIIKAKEMRYFSNLLDKILYMFRTGPLSIIRSISTLYTSSKYLSC